MSLSTNKLACVLASIIGVPCNVPLPRVVLCVPMAVLNEGSQGFNGTPVSFKQTQGDPLLFSMLHRTAGSPWASHPGARDAAPPRPASDDVPSGAPLSFRSHVHVPLFRGLIARCGASRDRARRGVMQRCALIGCRGAGGGGPACGPRSLRRTRRQRSRFLLHRQRRRGNTSIKLEEAKLTFLHSKAADQP